LQELLSRWQDGCLSDSGAAEAVLELLQKENSARQERPAAKLI
jgi:hypothetical protein